MQIHIITIFPKMFQTVFAESIIKRAQDKGLVQIHLHNLRNWTDDKRQTVDDRPFGGGPGMVLMVEPIYKAVKDVKDKFQLQSPPVILTSAKGKQFSQKLADDYSKKENLIIICGHYEGVDERVKEYVANEEVTIGPYVLTGGELPAMVITDTLVRLISGVLGNEESLNEESYTSEDGTEYPQYTRPAIFKTESGQEWKVPNVLLEGNHELIGKWRKEQQKKT